MKKIFTLLWGLVAALAVQAQSDFPLQFADKDGNIIADGTVLTLKVAEADDFGDVLMPTNLFVKNTSDNAVQGGAKYVIQSMGSGAFQTCFPENCIRKTAAGSYTTEAGTLEAGVLKDMKTEWVPTAEGSCKVTYQLITFKQNPITKQWMEDKSGPTVTLNFTYDTSGIVSAQNDKKVRTVAYYNLTGRRVQTPAHGMYIVKTTYADGTESCKKHLYK